MEGRCMLTDGRPGFVSAGWAVTLELPHRWSPVLRTEELAPALRRGRVVLTS